MSRNWLWTFVAIVALLVVGRIGGMGLTSHAAFVASPATVDINAVENAIDVRSLPQQSIADYD